MCHLQACTLEATLDIKPFIRLAAVQDGLVASDILSNEIESLDDFEPKLLALLVFGHCDVLNVSNKAKVMDTVSSDLVSELRPRSPG